MPQANLRMFAKVSFGRKRYGTEEKVFIEQKKLRNNTTLYLVVGIMEEFWHIEKLWVESVAFSVISILLEEGQDSDWSFFCGLASEENFSAKKRISCFFKDGTVLAFLWENESGICAFNSETILLIKNNIAGLRRISLS